MIPATQVYRAKVIVPLFSKALTLGRAICVLVDKGFPAEARILNENGFKTGDGLPLTSTAVGYVRKAYGLKSRFDRLREPGMLTMFETARRCGVSTKTISDWRRRGRIRAHAINDRNQFLFEDPGANPPRKHVREASALQYKTYTFGNTR
jgi:hypothetical protein